MNETINIQRRVIERCLEGDIKAQYHLYTQYSKAMYNIAIRFLNNKMDAEDILQEAFVTAFSRLGELKNPDVFGSWIKRIVINKCISLQRKRKISFEEIDEYKHGEELDADEGIPLVDPALVHKAIRELPHKGRTVLVLRALEGYSHKEIAETLDVEAPDDRMIWEGIRNDLQEGDVRDRKNRRLIRIRNMAAVAVLVLSVGYVVFDLIGESRSGGEISLASIDSELGDREREYQTLISYKMREAGPVNELDNIIIEELLEEIQRLDTIYEQTMKDLGELGYNEQVINTIFDTYEKKIYLLELIILENNKIKNHEREKNIFL